MGGGSSFLIRFAVGQAFTEVRYEVRFVEAYTEKKKKNTYTRGGGQ